MNIDELNEQKNYNRLKSISSGSPIATNNSINIKKILDKDPGAKKASAFLQEKPYYFKYMERMKELEKQNSNKNTP